MIVLDFCFKEFKFGLHADSIVLVNFLHVLGSIEGRFISLPYAFKQTLGLICHNYCVINHPGMYFALVCLECSNACLSIRVDKCHIVCRAYQLPWTDY